MLPIAAANQSACWDVPGTPSPFSGTWDSLIGNGNAVGVSGHEWIASTNWPGDEVTLYLL